MKPTLLTLFIAVLLLLAGAAAAERTVTEPPIEAVEEEAPGDSTESNDASEASSDQAESADESETPTDRALSSEGEIGETPTPSPENSDMLQAREHFLQGLRLVRQELWRPALAEFQESLRRHPSTSAAFNEALCLQRLRRHREALTAFESFLRDYEAEIGEAQRAQIEETIHEIRSLLTEVRLSINAPGATITVDDSQVGTSPLEEALLLHSGEHTIAVELEGYLRQERPITVVFGQPMDEEFRLMPIPRMGMLRVVSPTPDANLEIDGRTVGELPFGGEVREGRHELVVTASGYRESSLDVHIAAGSDHLESVELRRMIPRSAFFSMVGATIASLLACGGLGIAALVYDTNYDPNASNAVEWHSTGHDLMLATDVTLGVTAALAVATLVMAFFTDWDRGDATRTRD